MEGVESTLNMLPPNVKEPALFLLAEKEYDEQCLHDPGLRLKPTDGSDWKEARIKRFHTEIFQQKKNVVAVAKLMRVPVKTAYNFYLTKFKFSDDYRLLKTILQEEHTQRMEVYEHEMDECDICGDGGSLLICDGCEGEFHMDCVKPALEKIPEGTWECDECVDKRLLAARDMLVRETGLFRLVSKDEMTTEEDVPTVKHQAKRPKTQHQVFEPSPEVLAACRKLALTIHEAFASSRSEETASTTSAAIE